MNGDEFRAMLDGLGYAPSQAAEAIGCTTRTVERILFDGTPVSGPVARALEYHAKLVELSAVDRIPDRKRGRPKLA